MAGSRDFKVKNGLIVGDSATIKGPLVVEGGLTLSAGTSITGTYAGFDSDFNAKSTTDLSEGNNLYFTTARADSDFDVRLATKSTADLAEGTNLYYTTARADSDFDERLTTKSTTDVAEGTNLYYTTARADSDFDVRLATKTTTDVAEGNNLYYTTARADSDAKNAISVTDAGGDGSLAYNNETGIITYTGPSATEVRAHISGGTGVTITDGEIAIGQPVGIGDSVHFGPIRGDSFSVGEIAFRTGFHDSHIPFEEGAVWYDPHHKNLNYYTDFDHPIEIGMQVIERVYNANAYTILKGQPLYYVGNRTDEAGQESPTVALANATESTKYNVQGLAAEDIPVNSYGQIVVAGVIDGFDTSSLTAGLNFFAGLTDGALQNAPPSYPNYPMCLGWVIKSDATDGKVIINQQNHSVNSFRVQGDTHISADLRIDGNLIVAGTQTITSTENVSIGGNIQYLNAGNTIGQENTVFVGTGLNDAFYAGHYNGDSSSKSFFVKIDATGTPDTFEWGFDSAVGTEATGIAITGAEQLLAAGISIDFGTTTGHTVGDKWTGSAAALDTDTGLFSNKNEGDAGDGYTHVGIYWDASENEWTFVSQYDSEPEAPINRAAASFEYGDVRGKDFYATTFNGALSGNASTATALETGRNFSLTGDITASAVSFNGTGAVQLTTAYNPGSIVNADINASAAIEDTKLATISTASKVSNSATTATDANTASAIVARDGSGNFSAGTITANLTGNVTGQVSDISNLSTDSLGEGSTNLYFTSARVDAVLDATTTDSIGEGSTNLYYTTARSDSDFDARLTTKSTSNLSEGTNLYYTTARADSDFDIRLTTKSTTNLSEGTNLYYTTARSDSDFDARLTTKTTDNLTEGTTNKYFSNTLARGAISITDAGGDGSLGYVESSGEITYTGPSAAEVRAHFSQGTNISISSGEISTSATPSFTSLTLSQTTGTAPMTVTSTTLVSNLNADLLDGQQGSHYRIDVYDASGTLLN